jgi:hypothetical protein
LDAGYSGIDDEGRPWEASSEEDSGECTAAEAGERLSEFLIRLRITGVLSAKQTCILAWWAKRAGAIGPVGEFGAPPDLPSTGHYQRRIDAFLKLEKDGVEYYINEIPGQDKASAERVVHHIEMMPPHESLQRELTASPGVLSQIEDSVRNSEWASNYRTHPVVQASEPGEVVVPIALYTDGVGCT